MVFTLSIWIIIFLKNLFMLKRIWLFLITNLAVIVLLNIVVFILESVFNVSLGNYAYIFVLALVIWFFGSFISLFMSKWSAKRLYNIRLIQKDEVYNLDEKEKLVWDTVSYLAERNHINMPEVGIYNDNDPNAFATWATKNSSLVAVSTGLLSMMNKEEIEWVVAHEMAHILNWDMITMTLLQWVINTFVIFASRVIWNIVSNMVDEKIATLVYFLVSIILEIVFGILASIIVMWFSRHREYRADEWSAIYVWKNKMIAGLKALQRMQNLAGSDKEELAVMKISTKNKSWLSRLFSSHPDLEDRIANLESKSF